MEDLLGQLREQPAFNVITGPPDSGKSRLLTELKKKMLADDRPVLDINLRSVSFDSVSTLASTLEKRTASWLQQFAEVAKNLKLDAGAYGFQIKTSDEKAMPPITRLNDLLESLTTKLPPHTFWHGCKAPVFIIDEANELGTLTGVTEGEAALHNLFKWLVLNTKERRRFHVLLASSDSFFHRWVADYIGASRYETFVIGNLDEHDAKKFWELMLKSSNYSYQSNHNLPDFQMIHTICGGNMLLMENALKYWKSQMHLRNNVSWELFPCLVQERSRLYRACFNPSAMKYINKSKPCWTKETFFIVMKKLVNATNGFLFYNDLCKELGQGIVDSFIEHNIVHLRPTSRCSYDLPIQDHQAIITTQSACSRIAMKKLLEKNSSN